MASLEVLELEEAVETLKEIRGKGTRLISLYIPAGYPLSEVASRIRSEISEASNIKSKQTRKDVVGALEKIASFLKQLRRIPENGLAIFCGNVSQEAAASQDIRLFYIVPPVPLRINLYRCDSFFYTEPLERLLSSDRVYGILVIDGREATVAVLRGSAVDIVKEFNNPTHQKIRKGGQSAMRFQRLIDEGRRNYFKRIGETMSALAEQGITEFIVAGPGPAKEEFLKEKPFDYRIKVIGTGEVGYTDEAGVYEVVQKIEEFVKDHELAREKSVLEEFFRRAAKGERVAFGNEGLKAIVEGRAEKVLLSKEARLFVKETEEGPKFAEEGIPLSRFLRKQGAPVEVVGTTTQEGAQFLAGFKGFGVLLRY